MTFEVQRVIEPRRRDLGEGFMVERLLPVAGQRSVGPFIFLDHFGPVTFGPGRAMDVRPHPHIGLATVTYLFEGEILHRDSLGSVQAIRRGAVNWMTAGRGIVHSERTPPELRAASHRLHGVQAWVALPDAAEETEPAFHHHPVESLPEWEAEGVRLRLVAGQAYGREAPVQVFSPLFYVDAALAPGTSLRLPQEHPERACYVVEGEVELGGQMLGAGRLAVLSPGDGELRAAAAAHVMLLGGETVGPRTIWWNLVSSRPERIEAAKAAWREDRFPKVPGESERIPLPEA